MNLEWYLTFFLCLRSSFTKPLKKTFFFKIERIRGTDSSSKHHKISHSTILTLCGMGSLGCCGRQDGAWLPVRDENGSDTNGYYQYHICFHISGRIRIRIRIMSIMSDKIGLDVYIINIRFKYSNTDTVSDVEYSDSDTNISKPL